MSNTRATTFSPQKNVMKTILYLQKKYGDETGENSHAKEIHEDLDTLRRLVSGMSERAYRVHIEDSEKQGSFFRKLTTTVSLFLLFSITAVGQAGYDVSKLEKVDPYFVTSFVFADCQNYFDTVYALEALPVMIRSRAIGEVYEFDEFIPYKVYWTPWRKALDFSDTYHISSGRCRGFSFGLPAKCPGIYTTVFEHGEKPCVMQIAITPADFHQAGHLVEMRFFQRCHPNVIFRRYEPPTLYLNLPEGQPLDIEVYWKKDDGKEVLENSKDGFELLKTVHTSTSHRFRYRFPKYGIYMFRMKSSADRYFFYDHVRIRPDAYDMCSGISIN